MIAQFWRAVEDKVKASSTTALLSGVLVSWLAASVFHGVAPEWVPLVVGGAVSGVLTFVAGWMARHTPRDPSGPSAPLSSVPPSGGTPPTP